MNSSGPLGYNVIRSGLLTDNGKQQRAAKEGVLPGPPGHVHKTETATTISVCTNGLQQGGGTEGLLYILEFFVLPVTNSGSFENVAKRGFDTICTSWAVMLLFNPGILTILKHIFISSLQEISASLHPHVHSSHIFDCCVDVPIIWTGSFRLLTFI